MHVCMYVCVCDQDEWTTIVMEQLAATLQEVNDRLAPLDMLDKK